MSHHLIQINFEFKGSRSEFEDSIKPFTEIFAALPGLQWKIWLMNEGGQEAGGIYLFSNKESAVNYKNSTLFKGVLLNPSYKNVSAKGFDILEGPSLQTRALFLSQRWENPFNRFAGRMKELY